MATPILNLFLLAALLPTAARAGDLPERPARAAAPNCVWEKFSDLDLGLAAWVQRCNAQGRRIDFTTIGHSLAVHYSDSDGPPDPVVDVIALKGKETAEAGIRRVLAAHTGKADLARCQLAPYGDAGKYPAGVKRYTFVPNADYAKQLAADADPEEVPDPPCGDWGEAPDGIQYFEAQAGATQVLFVRAGQDEPLFDEDSLRLLR